MSIVLPVILSGGAGTRLWPASRKSYPKPFMPMPDGETLLAKTLRRALAVASHGQTLTVTARELFFLTRDHYQRVPGSLAAEQHFLLEPVARNTAPAVLLAAHYARDVFGPDCILLILPADHLIDPVADFAADVQHAVALARNGYLVTFGIPPDHPETGFGYLQRGVPLPPHGCRVAAFVEKPNLQRAQAYLEGGEHLWNAGMFCFSADTLLSVAAEVDAKLAGDCERCWASTDRVRAPIEFDGASFAALPGISIDYALMERASEVAMVPASFQWSDVGSWKAVSEIGEPDSDGNRSSGRALMVASRNTFVQSSGRLVATVGVEDLVVIDTGDAVLVSHREQAQQVREVVERLSASNDELASVHSVVHRPWGSYEVLQDADDCKVKRLIVKPGQVLSLQLHHRRSEHWTVVQGVARVTIGEREFDLPAGEACYIPVETRHRLANSGTADVHVIEVQCGDYFGEDDIVRFEDRYGRS